MNELEQLVTVYEEALRFYASPELYRVGAAGRREPIFGDLGAWARDALARGAQIASPGPAPHVYPRDPATRDRAPQGAIRG